MVLPLKIVRYSWIRMMNHNQLILFRLRWKLKGWRDGVGILLGCFRFLDRNGQFNIHLVLLMAYTPLSQVASTTQYPPLKPYKTPYNKSKNILNIIPYTASATHIPFQHVYHINYYLENYHIFNKISMYHYD